MKAFVRLDGLRVVLPTVHPVQRSEGDVIRHPSCRAVTAIHPTDDIQCDIVSPLSTSTIRIRTPVPTTANAITLAPRTRGRLRDPRCRGEETFPANPPADGWSDETRATFTGMAGVDTAGLLTLVFVADYERDGDAWPMLGAVALIVANYSATIYAFPTWTAGVWDEHPLAYRGLDVVYLPVVALNVCYATWVFRGEF
jgi:hypothetical protein